MDLDPGAAAGIGIGGAVAGALLAALALIFFFTRRRNAGHGERGDYSYAASNNEAVLSPKKGTTATVSFPDDSAAVIVEHNLPQNLDDAAISSDFTKIDDKINGHVESFYSKGTPTNSQASAQAILQAIGTESTLSLSKLSELLANPSTRPVVLRMAVARIIVSRLRLDSDPPQSFLPRAIADSVHSMLPIRSEDSGETRCAMSLGTEANSSTQFVWHS